MSRIIVAALITIALTGCATRDWVPTADVNAELARREQTVALRLQTATGTARQRLHVIEGALVAARRALDAGNTERARQELQVAIDIMDGVR